jgi:hypothetical protein
MKNFGIGTLIVIILIICSVGIFIFQKSCGVANKVTDPDKIISNYEEFQEIYNTCYQINTDICNMKDAPETDKMFEQFSKTQRILALRTNLNKWVNEYNAKSKMFTREMWKSPKLPYQLELNQFNCY